jgi:benzylsuccinate CoA-transferase BbsF subunit
MVEGKRLPPSPAPLLGQHNTEIISGELGSHEKETEALASQGIIEKGKPIAPMPSTNKILQGIRVLAFTNGYAGPYAGRFLAQYGAEVIKVESMKGGLDAFRHYGQSPNIDAAPRFIECNLGVRSITVNLKHPVGARLLKELASQCDAVLVNFRPGVLERLGLGNEEIRKANPKIIILKLPGLGETGPKSWYGTWGFNLTAFCGMTYLWNHPGQPRPIGSQGVYPDHVGFVLAPTVLVAALLHRRLTGRGVTIDLAQAESTAYTLGVSYLEAGINGREPQPQGNRDPVAAPQGCYPCQGEDRWCVVSINADEQWVKFCRVMGREDLIGDPRFVDTSTRSLNAVELDGIIEEWTRARSAEEVMERLQTEGVPAGVVQSAADLLKDPQLRHRNYFERFPDSPIGPFEIPRSPFEFRGMRDEPMALPSPLGKDTDPLLHDLLGYDHDSIRQWRDEGILT